jgi:predicted nuclease of restriction endonuclease-like (RecB) superfamily
MLVLVVERLSDDLKATFPKMKGFSPQNLWLIRQFYSEYQKMPNLQQLVGEIPWGHNVLIMQRIKDEAARHYYLEATPRLGWTQVVHEQELEQNLIARLKDFLLEVRKKGY